MTNPKPSPGFLLSSTSNPRNRRELTPPCLSRPIVGAVTAPASSSSPVLSHSLGSMVRVTGIDSRKLVLWIREERVAAGDGGVLREVRGTGRTSGSKELSEPAGGGGGRSRGGGSLRTEAGDTAEW